MENGFAESLQRNGLTTTLTTRYLLCLVHFVARPHASLTCVPSPVPPLVTFQGLKHILKPMISEDGKTPPTDDQEENFVSAITLEIDKVDEFFTSQENELYAEFRSLCQQVWHTDAESSTFLLVKPWYSALPPSSLRTQLSSGDEDANGRHSPGYSSRDPLSLRNGGI